MSKAFGWSALFCILISLDAVGQGEIYDNGPANGGIQAWTINYGYEVSNSLVLGSPTTVTDLVFAACMLPRPS